MKKRCPICGEKISKLAKKDISDGVICASCGLICNKSMFTNVETVQNSWKENHRRFQEFETTMKVTSLMSGYIFIDAKHQYVYISNHKKTKQEPIVFAFSEVDGYRIEIAGVKTVSKKKGGIGRAVVGGALFGGAGAIVGAATAKTETKTTGGLPILYLDLTINGLKTTLILSSPPSNASQIFDSMINA